MNGGLASWYSILPKRVDNRIRRQLLSLYEFLDLLFTAIQICIDIIQRLLRRRKKKTKDKKIVRQRTNHLADKNSERV